MPNSWTPPASDAAVWHPPATDIVVDSPRLSKAEVEAVMRQRIPQAFANPQAPQSLREVFSTDHPLDTALEFGKGLLWDTATGIGNAVLHPIDTARAMAKAQEDELIKAALAAKQGNYSGAGGHAMAAMLPVIGPVAANIGEEIGSGNEVARNVGRATALAISASPKNVMKPAAPYVKGAVKGVWNNATRTADFPVRLKGVPIEIPNTPQIAADVAGGAAMGHFVGPVGSAAGAAVGAGKNIVQGVYRGIQDVVAAKRAAAMEAAKPAPVAAEPSFLPPPAPMPEVQPMVDLPGPSGQFVDVPQPPPNPGTIPAPAAPSILDIKRAEAMQRMNPQAAAPVAEVPRFDPRSLPPDPIRQQPWYADAVAAMKARRAGAPEVAAPEVLNPAVADEAAVPMIQQMAKERTPNVLADVFRNISPEQRSEVIKAFDRNVITAAQEAVKKQLEAQGVTDPAIIESAMQAAKPDFADTVPARIAKARANKAEALFSAAREAGITPTKMEKLTPAKWEELSIKAGVRKPTWTANGSETVREVIQMAKEWEAKNGPIQAPPKPMKAPSVTPSALNTPEKIAAAKALAEAIAQEDDGLVTVYHHTSADRAAQIRKTGMLRSAGEPDVYVTTEPTPTTGYGDSVVPIRVRPDELIIDDEFPGGRIDYRLPVGKPGGSRQVKVAEQALEPAMPQAPAPAPVEAPAPATNPLVFDAPKDAHLDAVAESFPLGQVGGAANTPRLRARRAANVEKTIDAAVQYVKDAKAAEYKAARAAEQEAAPARKAAESSAAATHLERVKASVNPGDQVVWSMNGKPYKVIRKNASSITVQMGEGQERIPYDEVRVTKSQNPLEALAPKTPSAANPPEQMTAGEINKALDRLDKKMSELTDRFIAEGMGHLRPTEFPSGHPLTKMYNQLKDERFSYEMERDLRYGPGSPSRLPTGKGFGPRKK